MTTAARRSIDDLPCDLTAARNEVLYGDALILHDLIKAAGGCVTFHAVDDICHIWTLWPFAAAQVVTALHRIFAHLRDVDHTGTERKTCSTV